MEFGVCEDKQAWDSFVRRSPQGSIFCESRFLDALPDGYELSVVIEDGAISLGAVSMLRNGEVLPAPYPLTMYQGMLCSAESMRMPDHRRCPWLLQRIEFLVAAMAARRSRISLCLSHQFIDIRGFQWFNYHAADRGQFAIDVGYTGLLELNSFKHTDDLLAAVRAVRRQEYRRARERGLSVEVSTDIELLGQLHAATFLRQGITRPAEEGELLNRVSAAALRDGFGELLLCRTADGTPASATLFLYDGRYAYYYVGANDPQYRQTGSGTLLLTENLTRALSRGAMTVDFVGINSPRRGDFKTSFNARPTPYYTVDYRAGTGRVGF